MSRLSGLSGIPLHPVLHYLKKSPGEAGHVGQHPGEPGLFARHPVGALPGPERQHRGGGFLLQEQEPQKEHRDEGPALRAVLLLPDGEVREEGVAQPAPLKELLMVMG